MSDNYEHKITIILSDGDFIESMSRAPESQTEFDTWAQLAEKGLMNGHYRLGHYLRVYKGCDGL